MSKKPQHSAPTTQSTTTTTTTTSQDKYLSEFVFWLVVSLIGLISSGLILSFSTWFRTLFTNPADRHYLPCPHCRQIGPELALFIFIASLFPLYRIWTLYNKSQTSLLTQLARQIMLMGQLQSKIVEFDTEKGALDDQIIHISAQYQQLQRDVTDEEWIGERVISVNVPMLTTVAVNPSNGQGDNSNNTTINDETLTTTIINDQKTVSQVISDYETTMRAFNQLTIENGQLKGRCDDWEAKCQLLETDYQNLQSDHHLLEQLSESYKQQIDDTIGDGSEGDYGSLVSKYQQLSVDFNLLQQQHREQFEAQQQLQKSMLENQREKDEMNSSFYQLLNETQQQRDLKGEVEALKVKVSEGERLKVEMNEIHQSLVQFVQFYNTNLPSSLISRIQASLSTVNPIQGPSQGFQIDTTPKFTPNQPPYQQQQNTNNSTTNNRRSTMFSAVDDAISVGGGDYGTASGAALSSNNNTNRRQSSLHKMGSLFSTTTTTPNPKQSGLDINNTNLFTPQIPQPPAFVAPNYKNFVQNGQNLGNSNRSSIGGSSSKFGSFGQNLDDNGVVFNTDNLTAHRSSFGGSSFGKGGMSNHNNGTNNNHNTTANHNITHNPNSPTLSSTSLNQPPHSQSSQHSQHSQHNQIMFSHWRPEPPAALGYILEPLTIDSNLLQTPFPTATLASTIGKGMGDEKPLVGKKSKSAIVTLVDRITNSMTDQQRKTEAYVRVLIKDVNTKLTNAHLIDIKTKQELESLQSQLNTTMTKLDRVTESLAQKQDQFNALQASFEPNSQQNNGKESDNELSIEIIALQGQIDDLINNKSLLELDITSYLEQIATMTTQIQELQLENQQLDQKCQELDHVNQELEHECEGMGKVSRRNDQDLDRLQQDYEQLQIDFDQLNTSYQTLHQSHEAHKEEFNILEDANQGLKERLDKIQGQYDEEMGKIEIGYENQLNAMKKSFQQESQSQQDHIIELQENFTSVKNQIYEKEHQLGQLNRSYNEVMGQNQSIQFELTSLKQQLTHAHETIKVLQESARSKELQHNSNHNYEHEVFARQLDEKQDYIETLLVKIGVLNDTLSKDKSELSQQLSTLMKENKDIKFKYKKLQKDLQLSYDTQDGLRKEIHTINVSYKNDIEHQQNILERSQFLINQTLNNSQLDLTGLPSATVGTLGTSGIGSGKIHGLSGGMSSNGNGIKSNRGTIHDNTYDTDPSFLDFSIVKGQNAHTGPNDQNGQNSQSNIKLSNDQTDRLELERRKLDALLNEGGFQTPNSKHHMNKNASGVSNNNKSTDTGNVFYLNNNPKDSPMSSLMNAAFSPFEQRTQAKFNHQQRQKQMVGNGTNSHPLDLNQNGANGINAHIANNKTNLTANSTSTTLNLNTPAITQPAHLPQRTKQRHSIATSNTMMTTPHQNNGQNGQNALSGTNIPNLMGINPLFSPVTLKKTNNSRIQQLMSPFRANQAGFIGFNGSVIKGQNQSTQSQQNRRQTTGGMMGNQTPFAPQVTPVQPTHNNHNIHSYNQLDTQQNHQQIQANQQNQQKNNPNNYSILQSPTHSTTASIAPSQRSVLSSISSASQQSQAGFTLVTNLRDMMSKNNNNNNAPLTHPSTNLPLPPPPVLSQNGPNGGNDPGVRISHPERDMLLSETSVKPNDILLSVSNIELFGYEDYIYVINHIIVVDQPFFVVLKRDNAQIFTYMVTIDGKIETADGTSKLKKRCTEVSNRVATNSPFDSRPYQS